MSRVAAAAVALVLGFLIVCAGGAVRAHAAAAPASAEGAAASAADASSQRGGEIYGQVCAQCHAQPTTRAPRVEILKFMSAGAIYRTLSIGAMKVQARDLSDEDKRAVAAYLSGGRPDSTAGTGAPACDVKHGTFDFDQTPAFPGWGLAPGSTRFLSAAVAGLGAPDLGSLKVRWAISFPNASRVRSQPAVAGGALFVGSQDGTVYSLNLETGCTRWTFKAPAEVRTGLVVGDWPRGDRSARPAVYFGDLIGNVYSVDAVSGALNWQDHTDEHASVTLSGTPTLYRDRLLVPVSSLEEAIGDPHYECCTFRGSVIAYDARSGHRVWQTFMSRPAEAVGRNSAGAIRKGPSGAAIWNSPTLDPKRGVLYVGTGDNYSDPITRTSDSIVAMDLATGRIRWSWQALSGDAWNGGCVSKDRALCPSSPGPDHDFGSPPVLATLDGGRQILVAGQKSGWAYGLDPDRHVLLWRRRLGRGGIEGGVHFGIAADAERAYVPVNDMTDAAYGISLPETPHPGIYALDLRTGHLAWSQPNDGSACNGRPLCTGGYSSPPTVVGGMLISGSIDGWLRIMDAASGKELWKYDTTQTVRTVGGGETHGGSMAGATSALVYRGQMIVESGYDFSAKMPGDVLMVFAADAGAGHSGR